MIFNIFNRNDDKLISIALISYSLVLAIQLFFLINLGLFGESENDSTLLYSRVVLGIFFLIALPSVLKRRKKTFLITYLIVIFVYLFYFLFFPENRGEIISNAPFMFLFNLPAFLYAMSITNYKYFKSLLYKLGLIILVLYSYLAIMIFLGQLNISTYSMSLSYYLLISAIIFFDKYIEKTQVRDLIMFMISLFIMLTFGSRGAIIPLILFIFIKLFTKKSYSIKFYAFKMGTLLGIAITTVLYKPILETVHSLLSNMGLSSRTVNSLLSSEINSSGRDDIYTSMIGKIKDNPIIGYGLYGDRVLRGNYAHNILIEFLLHYGIIIGSLFLIIILFLLVRIFFRNRQIEYDVILIYFCLGFMPLMLSYSYLIYVNFWIFLGLLLQMSFKKREEKISKTTY